MPQITSSQLRRLAGYSAQGLLTVALVTAICFSLHVNFAITSFIYLLVIVLQSIWGGFGSSVIVSIAATACLDFFFVPPLLEWQISDPEDIVALAAYCGTSLVITRLASKARAEARAAEQQRRDARLLYEIAARLLSLGPEVGAGPEGLRVFREVLHLDAVCIFDTETGKCQIDGESVHGLAAKTREACLRDEDCHGPDHKMHILRLRSGGKTTGAIGFEGHFEDASIALPLSALAATALERMRSFTEATKAAADAQAEMLRSAILDAFAHEFKTPLAIILAAAGGLREFSGPRHEQIELTEIIENQTERLNRLVTRLLRMARLDRNDVAPNMEAISVDALLGRLIEECRKQSGRRVSARVGGERVDVMADEELLSLAITQLLDNACRYSPPESPVAVELDVDDDQADIRVTNEGSAIAFEEQDLIFDRFFRGSATEHVTPGTGLGLYVARKIVRAHNGVLELDRRQAAAGTTTFRIRMPIIRYERAHEPEAHQSISSGR